jgi:hypothetical protein
MRLFLKFHHDKLSLLVNFPDNNRTIIILVLLTPNLLPVCPRQACALVNAVFAVRQPHSSRGVRVHLVIGPAHVLGLEWVLESRFGVSTNFYDR